MKTPIPDYKKETCECCGQTTTYASKINRGLASMLRTFANAVQTRGNNITMKDLIVDPKAEEWSDPAARRNGGRITPTQYDNRSHLRCHGLIANIGTNKYCLTKKGAAFLRGEPVEAIAIVQKKTHSNIGYLADPNGTIMTTIQEVYRGKEGYWAGWDYDIVDGELVFRTPVESTETQLTHQPAAV